MSRDRFWKELESGGAVPVEGESLEAEALEWAQAFETADRVVAQDEVGEWLVSTVFLGIDHAFFGGPPLIYETMIFARATHEAESFQMRYHTRESAEIGHRAVLEALRAGASIEALDQLELEP